jgi:hypothetical protein
MIDAYRAGERRQVRALAEASAAALGASLETRRLRYRQPVFWPHLLRRASLAGLTRDARRLLAPPWPDLVITAGVRNEPVGRWLQQASGGATRYVHVGRPWGHLDDFDLLVTTPQYRVPAHPRVLNNALTLHDLDAARLARWGDEWGDRLADLPRPRIAVLVGGDSGPYTLGERAAERLLRDATALARREGGSLLLTTSARTAPAATARLRAGVATLQAEGQVPARLHAWGDPGENPYPGYLALAEAFVVSGDSIAMLSEACATGRPVCLFDTGGMREDAGRSVPDASAPGADEARDPRPGATLYRGLMRHCPASWSRDISLVHRTLIESGRAAWLTPGCALRIATGADDGTGTSGSEIDGSADLARAVARVRALLEG